ncbi:uncharacterized protein M6B38_281985 [Iris pallida]|uniref:Transmembrane protein n=1 Tax=Iris pallida TaxID=29817 RepID=A0AAX6HZP3_IRIPA|nr:uncharacterized protein M6B38_281985 [Iris pallida]
MSGHYSVDTPDSDDSAAAGGSSPTTATSFGEDDFSIFPPSLHENLTPSQTLTLALALNTDKAEEDEECVGHVRWRRRLSEAAARAAEVVGSKIRGGGGGGTVWSFLAVAGLVGVLVYMRWRHRREKRILLLLILDKDKKIAQLMKQVAQMNEVISSRPRFSIQKST